MPQPKSRTSTAPAERRDWYRIDNKGGVDPAEVYIYDEIGESFFGGVSADAFTREVAAIDATAITVHINSPGGFCYDGIAILNALRGHKAKVTTIVDGLAASAASFIAMAGDEVVMNRNSQMMVHDPSGMCVGNPKDMTEFGAYLEKMGENIASIYADKAGGTAAAWRTAMKAETWYSAEEAVEAGLADRVMAADPDAAKATNRFDLSIFNYAGRRAAPNPVNITVPDTEEPEMDLKAKLIELLGLDAEADEAAVFAAVEELVAARKDVPTDLLASANLDRAGLDRIVAEAANGRRLAAQIAERDTAEKVEAAVRNGQIAPARAEHWRKAINADPEMSKTLDSLPKNLIPVAEVGHAQDELVDTAEWIRP